MERSGEDWQSVGGVRLCSLSCCGKNLVLLPVTLGKEYCVLSRLRPVVKKPYQYVQPPMPAYLYNAFVVEGSRAVLGGETWEQRIFNRLVDILGRGRRFVLGCRTMPL